MFAIHGKGGQTEDGGQKGMCVLCPLPEEDYVFNVYKKDTIYDKDR